MKSEVGTSIAQFRETCSLSLEFGVSEGFAKDIHRFQWVSKVNVCEEPDGSQVDSVR